MLAACHQQVLQMLDSLERLGNHLDQIGADAWARQAACDLMRFFDLAAVHHHNDEELHVVPRLRRLGSNVLAQKVLDEHRALARDWDQIRRGLSNLSIHADELREGLSVRRAAWRRFAADYRAHIGLEEREVFPAIRAAIDTASLREIGEEMSRRRAADHRFGAPPDRVAAYAPPNCRDDARGIPSLEPVGPVAPFRLPAARR